MEYLRSSLIALLMLTGIGVSSAQNVRPPDFAYPKKIIVSSEAAIDDAVCRGDHPALLRSLMDYTLAETAITDENAEKAIVKIDSVAQLVTDPAMLSILRLLCAELYQAIYDNDRFTFNSRSLPLTPLPSDYRLWSGEQFRQRIAGLCDSALYAADALKKVRLQTLTSSPCSNFTQSDLTCIYYPTVYDFVVWKAISLYPDAKQAPGATSDPVLALYDSLLKFHADHAAPYINAAISRRQYLYSYLSGEDSELTEQETMQELRDIYALFSNDEFSGDALIAINDVRRRDDGECARWLYTAVRSNLDRFPAYPRRNCLTNILSELTQASLSATAPQTACPGQPFIVKIHAENIHSCTLQVYSVPDTRPQEQFYNSSTAKGQRTLVASIPIRFQGSLPFSCDTVASLSLPAAGTYIIVPESPLIKGTESRSYGKILCSELMLGLISFIDNQLFVIDPLSGAPIEDATITLLPVTNDGNMQRLGTTGPMGIFTIPDRVSGPMIACKGKSRTHPMYVNKPFRPDDKPRRSARIFTDLAIYHPSDSVGWACVAWCFTSDMQTTLKDTSIDLCLIDANGITADSCTAVTDEFGRVSGSFRIPEGRLTGNYHIEARCGDERLGHQWFMVSDYKLPTYSLEISAPRIDEPETGHVTLSGYAKTYSGFSMAGVEVTLRLMASDWSPWRQSAVGMDDYTVSVSTDHQGRFTFVLADTVFSSIAPRLRHPVYTATVTATSPTGETRTASRRFARGPSLEIEANLPSDIDVSRPVLLDLRVTDPSDSVVEREVNYLIISGSDTVTSGVFSSARPEVDWKSVKGGRYDLRFSLTDGTADPITRKGIAIYRPTDPMPPADDPVWAPENAVDAIDGRATILLGTSAATTHILYTLWTPERILDQRWIAYPAGMHRFETAIPDTVAEATVTLLSTIGMKSSTRNIKIRNTPPVAPLRIETEIFRDKVTPGCRETWTFRVSAADGSELPAAVMLDMYNLSLEPLAVQNWNFNPMRGPIRSLSTRQPYLGGNFTSSSVSQIKWLKCDNPLAPGFDTYGRSWLGFPRFRTYQKMEIAQSPERNALMTETAVMDSAPLAAGGAKNEYAEEESDAAVLEEMADEGATQTVTGFDYRDSEVPLALFRPMLTTDSLGRLTCTFTVPDANTTWQLNALAFTRRLSVAHLAARVIAAKPVMVQPNLPRFLRSGDTSKIAASVMNNTDTTSVITTRIEIFDQESGSVCSSFSSTDTVSPRMAATVAVTITVPQNLTAIGYRIRSSVSGFSDGEQALIPVLPASAPAIESMPFYMATGSDTLSLVLPEITDDALTSLQICSNPLWYVVTALPGLATPDAETAVAAASSYFSTSVALGLLRRYPAMAQSLHNYVSQLPDSATALLSDLALMQLQATPWMRPALDDIRRIRQLALLFEGPVASRSLDSDLSRLRDLYCTGGGWRWAPFAGQPSEWATCTILTTLGRLRETGMLDSKEIEEMAQGSLSWLESLEVERFRSDRKMVAMRFASLCTLWPEYRLSSEGRRLVDRTVQHVISTWKAMDLDGKISAALLLDANGHPRVARQIVESLGQFAEVSPENGMYWPSLGDNRNDILSQISTTASALQAIRKSCPASPDIDLIRQWLIIQKEATNWGASAVASQVIASMLLSSDSVDPTLTHRPSAPRVWLGDKEIPLSLTDSFFGLYRASLAPAECSEALLEVRSASTPDASAPLLCGSVVIRLPNSIHTRAASCPGLSIEKRIFRQTSDGWEETDTLHIGDRVRIDLTVVADRAMDCVVITDPRASCFEPVEQTPAPIWSEGIHFYRENRDTATNLFVTSMPRGTYRLSYELWVNASGTFTSPAATIQSQQAPSLAAHTSSIRLTATD